jgi:hypothetical protein
MTLAQTEQKPDKAAILAYLAEITRGWDQLGEPVMLELRCLFPGRTPDIARFTPDADGFDQLSEHAIAMNSHKLNAYVIVNPVRKTAKLSGATDDDIVAAFFFWADGDDEEAAHSIRNFAGPKWTMAVTTGLIPSPRPHIYWRCADAPMTDLKAWTGIQKAIAARLSTDPTVVNPSRIMRLPGTINWPTVKKAEKGRVAELSTLRTEYDDERTPVSYEQMLRAFGSGPSLSNQASAGLHIDTGSFQPLDRERATIQALSGNEWHNAVIRLVASYVGKGLSDGEIHALTDPLTLSGYTIDQTRAEVQTAIDGARRKGWAPEPEYADPAAIQPRQPDPSFDAPKRPANLEWFDDVTPSLTDTYLIKSVLGAGAMSVIYGPSNSGKTFLALDLAFALAIGAPWQGHRVKQCAVLYLAAEGGRGVLNRIAALKMEHGVHNVVLALKRAGLDLLHDQADLQHIADLAAEVTSRAPDLPLLIVIDTLSRIMAGGDENSAADMTALIRNIDAVREATGAHIMLVHHTGKDTARGARGHSSLRAATDTEIEVANEDGARAAMVTKQRDYQGGETFAFTLKSVSLGIDQDGDEVTSCVVEIADADEFKAAKSAKKGLGPNQQKLLNTFDQMVADGLGTPNPAGVGMPEPGRHMTVKIDDLREAFVGKIAATNKRGAFLDAFNALSDARGVFCASSEMVWRTDKRIR